ncbi:unnamed protein product [Oncorhynchus mykiss]|uniref:Uncharacterized protein n=1 Tax=Oncorhynchus mykiss TaxID=8022 RepID=A0A060WFS0_ONCMY|nr:unnamed protein product [Oncorhynchus mykiss]
MSIHPLNGTHTFPHVPRSSVRSIVRKYKHHGTTQPSYHSGRRCVLSPRDERTLVRKVKINPRTTAKDLVKMLEETGGGLQAEEQHPNCEARGGSIMLWGCFAAGGTGALHKIDGIMRKEKYVDILKQHLKTSVRQEVKAWSQMGLPNGH